VIGDLFTRPEAYEHDPFPGDVHLDRTYLDGAPLAAPVFWPDPWIEPDEEPRHDR
jgi:hypothetical protein